MNRELYLSSPDSPDFEERRVVEYKNYEVDGRPVLRVWVDIPLFVFDQKPDAVETNELFLTFRHGGDDNKINQLDSFPIDVYIMVPKKFSTFPIRIDDFRNLAWGVLDSKNN